jgi:hypothetical protein
MRTRRGREEVVRRNVKSLPKRDEFLSVGIGGAADMDEATLGVGPFGRERSIVRFEKGVEGE